MEILLTAFFKYLEVSLKLSSERAGRYKGVAELFIKYVKAHHKRRFQPLPLRDRNIAIEFISNQYGELAETRKDKEKAIEFFQSFLSERSFIDRLYDYVRWLQELSPIALVFGILVFLSVILGVVTGTVSLIGYVNPSHSDLVVQYLTETPERMPANGFNVAIAGFGFIQEDGRIIQSQTADDISDIVLASLSELPQVDNMRGWRSNGVGHVLADDPIGREKQAAEIADRIGADIVIYGIVHQDGLFNVLEPEFYVTARFASLEPELVGADTFGLPVEFVGNSKDQINASTNLKKRLTVLRFFLRGLALYISGNFAESRSAFESAIATEVTGLEVLYIFAGNAAVRQPDVRGALALYDAALLVRPNYARALLGRGSALYRLAGENAGDIPPPFDPNLILEQEVTCNDTTTTLPQQPQLLATLSLRCYHEAVLSEDKPETGDVDVKTAFGLGQVNVWLSLNHYGDYWDEAQINLQAVLDLFKNSETERQTRVRAATAHANAWLGLRLLSIDGSNPKAVQEAVTYYNTALALLRSDVNREYNKSWMDTYESQVSALNSWLESRLEATPTSV